MSLGLQFIRKAVETQDPAGFRRSRREWFDADELPAYEAALHHVNQYGSMPSPSAMQVMGHPLPELRGQDDIRWFADRLVTRTAYLAVNDLHPELAAAMQTKNMAEAERLLREMTSSVGRIRHRDSYSTLADEAQHVWDEFSSARSRSGLLGCPLRWDTLNEATNGGQGGDVGAIVGRPGLGKSWLLTEIAHDNFLHNKRGAYVSPEMSLKQITRRWMGRLTGINPNDIRKGELPEWAQTDLHSAIANFANGPDWYLMSGDMGGSMSDVEAMVETFEPEFLAIDALYLIRPAARMSSSASKHEVIGQVIKEVKRLVIRKDIPAVVTVQFNRGQKSRETRRPSRTEAGSRIETRPEMTLDNIAGTDSIGQDCSWIVGARQGPPPYADMIRELALLKNRDGEMPRWFVNFRFNPVNLDEIPGFNPGADATPAQLAVDVGWME